MKKFKLIQWYPSLSTDWKEGLEIGQGDRKGIFADFSPCSSGVADLKIDYFQVINNPEFWEEVVKPVFEISAFKAKYFNRFYYLSTNNRFNSDDDNEDYTLKEMFSHGNLNVNNGTLIILSVKRLADNQEFEIGDRVFFHDNTFRQWNIDNFFINEEGELLARSKDNLMVEKINLICKVEPVTFETYDGKTISESDPYFVVTTKFRFVQNGEPQEYPSFTRNKTKYFVFSSKEKAEVFILENNPCLSIKDIASVANMHPTVLREIENIVESKVLK